MLNELKLPSGYQLLYWVSEIMGFKKKKIFSVKMLAMNKDYISSVKSHNQITVNRHQKQQKQKPIEKCNNSHDVLRCIQHADSYRNTLT